MNIPLAVNIVKLFTNEKPRHIRQLGIKLARLGGKPNLAAGKTPLLVRFGGEQAFNFQPKFVYALP